MLIKFQNKVKILIKLALLLLHCKTVLRINFSGQSLLKQKTYQSL